MNPNAEAKARSYDVIADVLAGRCPRVGPVARHMNLSPQAIYKMIQRGEADAVCNGRSKSLTNKAARKLLGLDCEAA